ncbi:ABC transporter permease [Corynebacterium sp. H78]|uniref:ABC transporter permease n=1 Tax=Corynebacterium sp. H78 TaxID=3133417 RepID=UPI0030B6262A
MATSASTMRKVSLRSIAAHKLRLVLTILSVVLGTAFIAGAFVFTASLNKAFDGALSTAYDGIDVVATVAPDDAMVLNRETVEKISQFPGVEAANVGAASVGVIMTGSDGKAIQTNGAPSMGLPYYDAEEAVGSIQTYTAGHPPRGPDEVAINAVAERLGNLQVGDTITAVTSKTRAEFTVSGVFTTEADSTGWMSGVFPLDKWYEMYTDGEHVETLSLSVDDSTTPETVSKALTDAYPTLTVEPGSVLAERDSEVISQALGFVNYFLIAFGLIGLLVGMFIISNTFSMLVAQRTNEFALLRSLGASRGQLTRSVLTESFVVGLIGSILGIAGGFGLTKLLYEAMSLFGYEMPGGGLTATWTAFIIPLIAGVLITVVAAWAPASRAGAIPPVEAMRSGDATSESNLKVRTISGTIAALIGAALLIAPVLWEDGTTGRRATLVGIGAFAAIVAMWLIGPALSQPLVGGVGRVLGWPFGTVGKLASTNSQRNPRRTAATAFALMLGLALVVSVGMLGATMKNSVSEFTKSDLKADYVMAPPMTAHVAMPDGVRAEVDQVEGVETTAVSYFGMANVMNLDEAEALAASEDANTSPVGGPQAGNASFFDGDLGFWYSAHVIDGSLDLTAPDSGAVINNTVAKEKGWKVGDDVGMITPMGVLPIPITGIHEDTADPSLAISISPTVLDRANASRDMLIPRMLLVDVAGESTADIENKRSALEDAVADFLVVQVMDAEDYSGMATQSIDVMLGIVYGLLGLAVIISILGIINTLALSIVERRQEIGMLRAVGFQRRDIRSMIRLESVQIAIFGAITGIGLGLALGWSLLTVLSNEGLGDVIVPWGQIGIMLLASAVVGVLAAAWPAHKAASTPPLAAIAD